MLLKKTCREQNCACADCAAVDRFSGQPCKKYCENICKGQGKPLYEGPELPKCSYFQVQKEIFPTHGARLQQTT